MLEVKKANSGPTSMLKAEYRMNDRQLIKLISSLYFNRETRNIQSHYHNTSLARANATY